MRYKVGDKVRVRKDLENGIKYGVTGVTKEMTELKGRIVTIKEVNEYTYRIKEMTYVWTDEMFEPVITNWDKVKEEMVLDDDYNNPLCGAIQRMRNEDNCGKRSCFECKQWLKQPYKEPSILDEVEKKYLYAVIKPWRDRVIGIKKRSSYYDEYLAIIIEENSERDCVVLPCFKENTMYKGMELNKEYTLDELEI